MAIKHKGIEISNYWRNYRNAISSVRTLTGPNMNVFTGVYSSLE